MTRCAVPFIILTSCLLLITGCETAAPERATRLQAPRGEGARPFSSTEETVALNAIRTWHKTHAVEGMVYELDRYDRRIPRSLRVALREICPPLPPETDREDATLYTISIDQADLPFGNYAYAIIRVGNRFDAAEYAYIYVFENEQWTLRDHYLVARGLLNTVLIDFSWERYCREKGIPLPTGPASAP